MNRRRVALGIGMVLLLAIGGGISGSVAGADNNDISHPSSYQVNTATENGVNVTTSYPVSDQSQRVDVAVTISPTETEISNISVAIGNTDSAFIDFDSFGVTIEPSGAAEVNEELQFYGGDTQRVYTIDSLETDESVTITFEAYPRQLQSSDNRLDVAQVNYEFLRNGVQVPDNPPDRVTAVMNLSSSPVNEAQNLRTTTDGLWLTTGVSVLLGIVGIAAAVWMYSGRDSNSGPSRSDIRDVTSDLEDLERRLEAVDQEEAREEAERIKDKVNDFKY
jgi:hypothetical protein